MDLCQKWPQQVQGHVSRCPVSKFEKKIPKGSVPNCRLQIANCYGIRWFKYKLKPPKNINFKRNNENQPSFVKR